MATPFEGTVCLVWFSDGKQKFRYVTGSASLKAEIVRLREEGIPDRAMMALGINWETEQILAFSSGKNVESE